MASSSSSTLQHITQIIVLLPHRLVSAIVGALAWLVSWLPLSIVSAHRNIVINCLACFPELSYREVRALARRSLIDTARTLISFPYIWQQPPAKSLQMIHRVHGRAAVEAAIQSHHPVLLLSLHQSCWELQALELGRLSKVMILYKPGSAIDAIAIAGREANGCVTAPATGKGIRDILQEMKQGGALCILADHPPQNPKNPTVKFFSRQVIVPRFIHQLTTQMSPTIFYISTQRVGTNQFDIHYQPADESLYQLEEQAFLQKIMLDMETIIRRTPEQYNWAYNRFRRTADGKQYWYKRRNAMAIIRGAAKGEDINQLLAAYASKLS